MRLAPAKTSAAHCGPSTLDCPRPGSAPASAPRRAPQARIFTILSATIPFPSVIVTAVIIPPHRDRLGGDASRGHSQRSIYHGQRQQFPEARKEETQESQEVIRNGAFATPSN